MFKNKRTAFTTAQLVLLCLPLTAKVTSKLTDDTITMHVSGKPVLTYNLETVTPPDGLDKIYARSGFIHPIYSPTGKILTDPFPIGHVHQHALFNAWTRATYKHEVVDFWNQRGELGNVKHVDLGPVNQDSFEANLLQYSLEQGPALNERWTVTVQDSGNPLIFDLEIEQSCATSDEVYLHAYHYGGFAFRGSAHWSSEDEAHYEESMQILTGEGKRSIKKSNHTRPRWVAVYGSIDGDPSGLVIMDHPSNFRFPQPVRVHPRMPYFVFSPVVEGSFIIKPGLNYKAKYRIATFDGKPNAKSIEEWYTAFAGSKADQPN